MSPQPIDAATLTEWLIDGGELAVLDAREQGVYFDSHLFHAGCIPLSSVELLLADRVPRQNTRVVWCDATGEPDGLATRAAATATAMGWTDCYVLSGGTAGWAAFGGELYSGVNVPSKAFGEFVEHTYGTPRMPAAEVQQHIESGTDMVVLDSRPLDEFRNMSIPTGVDCPGAELVYRVKEMAPNPDTLVVVNCAGRTRSIIGSQSLINAGLENRVVALENGTMGWELAGLQVDRGREIHAPDPTAESRAWSEQAVAGVASRFGVRQVSIMQVTVWGTQDDRTMYLLDVRTPEEFEAGHLPGSVNAPGGQLVQATDEYVATQNARLVLIDDNGVRATMTASWLRQLGWKDAVVLSGGIPGHLAAGHGIETGPTPRVKVPSAPTISVADLAADLAGESPPTVLDVGSSLKYRRRGHVPGAWWGVRSRLDQARSVIGTVDRLVLTSSDGQLAKLAAVDAATWWPDAEIVALGGGNTSWRHAKQHMDTGFDRATTAANDVWYKPYDHDHDDEVIEQHMRDYLTWEIALVEQIDRDPTINFATF